ESITCPTLVVCVSTMVVAASTTTCSVTDPTLRTASMAGFVFTCKTMPVCTNVLKPCLLISSLYGPIGRLGTTYLPSEPLTAFRTSPVSVWVSLTCASGTVAPVGSSTVPDTCDVAADCAQIPRQPAKRNTTHAVARTFMYEAPL